MPTIAELKQLKVYFYDQRDKRFIRAVENVGFSIAEGSVLGIVGESGCGKTVTALSMMGLLGSEPGLVRGEFYFRPRAEDIPALTHALEKGGRNGSGFKKGDLFNLFHGLERYVTFEQDPFTIVKDTEKWLRRQERIMLHIRGKNTSMVFQNPWLSLNPFVAVGRQLESTIRRFEVTKSRGEVRERAVELLKSVRLRQPELILNMYAGSLSIGMAQRVILAIALASNPKLLIADEPTTGLDMTNVYKVIELLEELRSERNLTLLLISHDVGVVGAIASQIAVMYSGYVVETGSKEEVLRSGGLHHPYTYALLSSVPVNLTGFPSPQGQQYSLGSTEPLGPPDHPSLPDHPGPQDFMGPPGSDVGEGWRFTAVGGRVPDNRAEIVGCPFCERCRRAVGPIKERCSDLCPEFIEVTPGHLVRCYLFEGPGGNEVSTKEGERIRGEG